MPTVLGIDAPQGYAILDVTQRARPLYIGSGELGPSTALDVFQALLREHQPALVVIESVGKVYARERFCARMASDLCAAHGLGGELAGAAKVLGYRVVRVTALEVRRHFRIRAPKGKADAAVGQALRLRVPSWPAAQERPGQRSTGCHERDAGIAALYGWEREQFRVLVEASKSTRRAAR